MADLLALVNVVFHQLFSLPWSEVITWVSFTGLLIGYYALVWHFYHLLARRDTFHKDIMRYDPGFVGVFEMAFHVIVKIFKFGVLFPLVSFLWFVGFSVLLFVVVQSQPVGNIALIAISIISAARVLAYYNENMAEEFAKTLPIVILGVFILEPGSFNVSVIVERISEIPSLGPVLIQYVIYLSLLELTLRTFMGAREILKSTPARPTGPKMNNP